MSYHISKKILKHELDIASAYCPLVIYNISKENGTLYTEKWCDLYISTDLF